MLIKIKPLPGPTKDDVNAERSRRIIAGTTINIHDYGPVALQGRDEDKANLQGLAFGASMRIAGGDLETTTIFRDANNVDHFLKPPQIVEMWSLGSEWISAVFQASWSLKEFDPIPSNFADDSFWP